MAKNRVAYGTAVVILLLFVFLNEHSMTYAALYAVLVLPLISLCLTLVFRRHITISEQLSANYIPKGEVVQFKFYVRNHSFLPCACIRVRLESYSDGLDIDSKEKHLFVPAHKTHETVFNISAKYRGNYEIGVSDILVYDFLGLFKFKRKHNERLLLTVSPRVLTLPFLPLNSAFQDAAVRNYKQDEDYSVVADLRKYQPTDGYKKIHWKISAKRNELISKNFQETEENAAVLLVDNSRTSYRNALEIEDAVVEALVSAMAYCTKQGCPVSLSCPGFKDTDFGTNFAHLYKEACDLEFGDFGKFDAHLNRYRRIHGETMNLIVFVQNLNEGVFDSVQFLRLIGNNVILFYHGNAKDDSKIRQLRELNIHCVDYQEIQTSASLEKGELYEAH